MLPRAENLPLQEHSQLTTHNSLNVKRVQGQRACRSKKIWGSSQDHYVRPTNSSKQCFLLCSLCVALRTRPACKHKGNLVDEISNVVGHIEGFGGRITVVVDL